ncbi:MAG: hypothetical protein ACOCQX_02990 [Candidatus Nanoarchaeia archaeon]
MSNEHTFFVRLSNANQVRKELLGLSKSVISLLKRFQYIKNLREEKKKKIAELSSLFNEVAELTGSLNFEIPDLSLETGEENTEKNEKAQEKAVKNEGSEKSKESSGYEDELKKIEESAADIEKKINELF